MAWLSRKLSLDFDQTDQESGVLDMAGLTKVWRLKFSQVLIFPTSSPNVAVPVTTNRGCRHPWATRRDAIFRKECSTSDHLRKQPHNEVAGSHIKLLRGNIRGCQEHCVEHWIIPATESDCSHHIMIERLANDVKSLFDTWCMNPKTEWCDVHASIPCARAWSAQFWRRMFMRVDITRHQPTNADKCSIAKMISSPLFTGVPPQDHGVY